MMNYDRTLIEAQKRNVHVPKKEPESSYGTFLLIALGVVVIILLLMS